MAITHIMKTQFKLLHLARIFLFFCISKILFGPRVRIVKGWPRIINRGTLIIEQNFTAGIDLRLEILSKKAILKIGKNVKINDYFHAGVFAAIEIGDNSLIGSRVTIVDHNHGQYSGTETHSSPFSPPDSRPLLGIPIIIGSNVWIAEGVVILPGVTIGNGSIIGANSVVTKNIPESSIAIGAPAKVIKQYDIESKKWLSV